MWFSVSVDRRSTGGVRGRLAQLILTGVLVAGLSAGCAQGGLETGSTPDAGQPADAATDMSGETGGGECTTASDCPSGANATAVCRDGECVLECDDGFGDADGRASNGCECETSNGGTEACDGEDNDCDGEVDEDFDLSSDPDNCGMCGNSCEYANATGVCNAGVCEFGSCESGYANCDASVQNGCETNIQSDDANCGSCGNSCTVGNADRSCQNGSCTDLSCNSPYADCNGMTSDGCEVNTNTSPDHCGMCGKSCSYPNGIPGCDGGSCELAGCKSGHVDLNGNPSDGCEYACSPTGSTDRPDGSATDENCDGIDGNISRSVFVAKPADGGDNSNDGRSRQTPVASIAEGISIAEQCSPTCDVLIAAGTYNGSVTLSSGVEIFGGYDGSDWSRDITTNTTVLAATTPKAVEVDAPTERVTVGGLTVRAKDFSGGGTTTYGIWATDVSNQNLVIQNAVIDGGDAGSGTDGNDGGDGANGNGGGSGFDELGGFGGYSSCGADGGNGGEAFDCGSTAGQRGSVGGDSAGGGYGGISGVNRCGGCNDSGGDGFSGDDGFDGSNGAAPSPPGDTTGSFSNGNWSGANGSTGTRGRHGRGGGGGGAGGTDDDSGLFCPGGLELGGGGGGGGAGGCGGQPGGPGQPGGGSFAVALIDASADIRDSSIQLGRGGDGGAGGDGGDGGSGGLGDVGTSRSGSEAGSGASGGDGGDGGGGPGGPGGCGGPAIGIAKVGTASTQTSNVNFSNTSSSRGGDGGAGGSGGYVGGSSTAAQAPDGPTGCDGAVHQSFTY